MIRSLHKIASTFKLKYLPFITVYFSYNFANFALIAETFWIKNELNITAVDVVSISVWTLLPWTMKIIFGQLLDSVKIFNSQRRVYIFIGAVLMLIGNIITISIANKLSIINYVNLYNLLILAGFLSSCGFVLQDIVADSLCYEIVDKVDKNNKERPEEEVKNEIANIQVLVRIICIPFASMLALYISGFIAEKYSYAAISYFLPLNTLISITGALFITKEPKTILEKPNKFIILAAIIYFISLIIIALTNFKYSQEATLVIGLTIVILALNNLCKSLDKQKKKEIFCILLVCFAVRCVPEFGPGVEWWQIDVLKFNPKFFAHLAQLSLFLGFICLCFFGKDITARHTGFIFLILNTLYVTMQLPTIGMAFGLHEWTMKHLGFGAKTIALIDNSVEGPFAQLEFLLVCTLATYNAPKHNVATWFALSMSLMSLAYIAKRIIKRMLAQTYIVERGSYENIPDLMIATVSIHFLIPTIIIFIFMNPFKKRGDSV